MTMETVVYLMLLQNTAQNAHVIYKRLVQLVFSLLQLEMDIAMMRQTIMNATLMGATAVDHVSFLISVQIVLVMEALLAMMWSMLVLML